MGALLHWTLPGPMELAGSRYQSVGLSNLPNNHAVMSGALLQFEQITARSVSFELQAPLCLRR